MSVLPGTDVLSGARDDAVGRDTPGRMESTV